MPSFGEITDGWQFCGYELLNYRWERARVLAKTEAQIALIGRVEEKMREELKMKLEREAREPKVIEDIVIQTNGDKYAGPLVAGRFQVMEGFVSNNWYIADHAARDLMLRVSRDGEVRRFPTREAAEHFLVTEGFTTQNECGNEIITEGVAPQTNGKGAVKMARGPKKTEMPAEVPEVSPGPAKKVNGRKAAAEALASAKAERKAAKSAAPAPEAAPKRGRKSATTSGEVEFPVNATKAARKAADDAAKSEANGSGRRGRSVGGSGTLAGRTRELISEGKLTEAKMLEKLEAEFPDKKLPPGLVPYYFADMERRGMNPPPVKGGMSEIKRRSAA